MATIRPTVGKEIVFNCWEATTESPQPPPSPWTGVVTATRRVRNCLTLYTVKRDHDGAYVDVSAAHIKGYVTGRSNG